MPTKIPWATETWNPFHGCTPVSAGCLHCWAKPFAKRLAGAGIKGYDKSDPFAVTLHRHKLTEPYHWRKPRLVFVGSMSDMFHQNIPTSYIEQMFDVMRECSQHIFQILTKRPRRMAEHMRNHLLPQNVWLGTSVENTKAAMMRLPHMGYCHFDRRVSLPNAIRRIISYEPALGAVEFKGWNCFEWLIIGCESGPKRRPFKDRWARSAIEECSNRHIPVYVKQIPVNGKVSKEPSEWPTALQVQEYPDAMRRVLEAR